MNFKKICDFSKFFKNSIKKGEKNEKNKKIFPRPSEPQPPQEGLISSREPAAGLH